MLGTGYIDYHPILKAAKVAGVEYFYVEQEPPFVGMTPLRQPLETMPTFEHSLHDRSSGDVKGQSFRGCPEDPRFDNHSAGACKSGSLVMTVPLRFADYPSLEDTTVLITGGASELAPRWSSSLHFKVPGWRLLTLQAKAHGLIEGLKGCCTYLPRFWVCDLRDVSAIKSTVGEIEREFGTIRVLVNNAANDDRHNLSDVTQELWDERMAVNLRHQFFLIQSVAPV